jgi:hypothetical protein
MQDTRDKGWPTQDRSGRLDGLISAFVQVGDEEVEDGRILLWKLDRLRAGLPELAAESLLEVFGFEENALMHL